MREKRRFVEAMVCRRRTAVEFRRPVTEHGYPAPVGRQGARDTPRKVIEKSRQVPEAGSFCGEIDEIAGAFGCPT